MASNLAQRVGFAAVAIPAALGIVYWGGIPLALLVALAGALGARELFDLARRRGVEPAGVLGAAGAAAFAPLTLAALTVPDVARFLDRSWVYLTALGLVGLLSWTLWSRAPDRRPLEAAAVTLLGVLYAGALPAFLLAIRHGSHATRSWAGTWLVFFPLVVTWVGDTAAMFAGRALGGPKLWPAVSPAKTWSGSAAGLGAALLVVPVYDRLAFDRVGVDVPLWQGLVIAGVLSVVGQVGDLAESLFKREAGVKDSSALIPGHGGVLDRLDSLYFVVPVAAAMYRLFGL